MKVLWFTCVPMPAVHRRLGSSTDSCFWMSQMLNAAVEPLNSLSDEINYGFRVREGRVVFESREAGSFLQRRVLVTVDGADAATFRAHDQEFPEGARGVEKAKSSASSEPSTFLAIS